MRRTFFYPLVMLVTAMFIITPFSVLYADVWVVSSGDTVYKLNAQGIADPRPDARHRDCRQATVHRQRRLAVADVVVDHRANHGQVVGAAPDVRKQIADAQAALAVFFASLEESVGEFWFGESTEVVIEGDFVGFLGAKTV